MIEKTAIINVTSFGREFPEHLEELRDNIGPVDKLSINAHISSTDLAALLNGYKYVILGNYPKFDKAFFEKNRTIKLIARHGIGYNNIDLYAADLKGVYVTNMPSEIEVDAVAEQAVAILLDLSKNIIAADDMVKKGEWNIRRERLVGKQIYGSTTGVIGFGNIGQRFAEIMHHGFKNKIIVYDPYKSANMVEDNGYKHVTLEELLKCSDMISIHCSLTEETKYLISKSNLELMKKTAILINTARGEIVNEYDLYHHCLQNTRFKYGADVLVEEPAKKDNPLITLSNTLITPHSSIYNLDCMKAMNQKVIDDIYKVKNGIIPELIINKVKG